MYLQALKSIPPASVAKSVIGFVAAGGASIIAKDIIANNIDEPDTLIQKIKIVGGTAVVAMMVRHAVKDFIGDEIDDIETNYNTLKEALRTYGVTVEPTE